jgi:hypothetical protein
LTGRKNAQYGFLITKKKEVAKKTTEEKIQIFKIVFARRCKKDCAEEEKNITLHILN